jgi:hypothetical protein
MGWSHRDHSQVKQHKQNKNGRMTASMKDQVKRHRGWIVPGEVTDVEDGGNHK